MAERIIPPTSHRTLCKGCGAPIIWATTAKGAKMPLDAASGPHTYQLVIHEGEARAVPSNSYVSHFLTCSKAHEFSTKNIKPVQKEERV